MKCDEEYILISLDVLKSKIAYSVCGCTFLLENVVWTGAASHIRE